MKIKKKYDNIKLKSKNIGIIKKQSRKYSVLNL